MANPYGSTFLGLLFISLLCITTLSSSSSVMLEEPDTFIIHMSKSSKPAMFTSHHHWYSSILGSLSESPRHTPTILYSYEHAMNGFSAHLTNAQAAELKNKPGVLSIIPDRVRQVQTTHTPQFLGLSEANGVWPYSNYAVDIIVGILDLGIWPESPSFSDHGLPPIPYRWKGICETTEDFPASSCNRKIIGARYYYNGTKAKHGRLFDEHVELRSPRDTVGHGTHVASIAAGSVVRNASFYGYARGVARGVAPKARLAIYKVCWYSIGCTDSDTLAGIEQAIKDGVDVLSISINTSPAPQYDLDGIAIATFHAMRHGIVSSCSVGNDGPFPSSASNIAPWMLTVGASTVDRQFLAVVILGDHREFAGASVYTGEPLGDSLLPLIYAGDAGSKYCVQGELNETLVEGKIVLCDRGGPNGRVAKGLAVLSAGGAGMILANLEIDGEDTIADAHLIPSVSVGLIEGNQIREYATSVASPTATIQFKGTVIGRPPSAPRIASFSSRGPNRLVAELIKPDVVAPGVNILGAFTGFVGPTELDIDPRRVDFYFQTGTSMAAPHVAGLAALLQQANPTWSVSAIKSAIMTTSYNLDNSGSPFFDLYSGNESNPFMHGSGHIDPNNAVNPGLVYDLGRNDYVAYLCSIGYNESRIAVFTDALVNCNAYNLDNPGNLNYPSFSVVFRPDKTEVTYNRTVTNVGRSKNVRYRFTINSPPSVEIKVTPYQIRFRSRQTQTKSYSITFTSIGLDKFSSGISYEFGSIEWSDSVHFVRSPIAFTWIPDSVSSI